MLIYKITTGFVTQVFDTDSQKFIEQNFTAGDDVQYENENGEIVETQETGVENIYLPFEMKQPI